MENWLIDIELCITFIIGFTMGWFIKSRFYIEKTAQEILG